MEEYSYYFQEIFQLSPVGDNDDPTTSNFCFESPLFDVLFPENNKIEFDKIFRQSDPKYSSILNQIRIGRIKKKSIKILNNCVNKKIDENRLIKPTLLYPLKRKVEKINMEKLKNCAGKTIYTFNLKIEGAEYAKDVEYLKRNIQCDEKLHLCVGCQVMYIINNYTFDGTTNLCNGSQGIVIGFNEDGFPMVKFLNGYQGVISPHIWTSEQNKKVSIAQIPLILAWALTIHKSQGASIDLAEIDVGNSIFACGQTYVALSRVRSLEGLYLKDFNYMKIKVNRKVQEFYKRIKNKVNI